MIARADFICVYVKTLNAKDAKEEDAKIAKKQLLAVALCVLCG